MFLSRGFIGALSRDIRIKIVISVLCLIQTTLADLCFRLADCSCDSPSHLLCSGSTFIDVADLLRIVSPIFLLSLDCRGRIFSEHFIPQLGEAFPKLQEVRLEGSDCSKIIPYLNLMNFTIYHTCHQYLSSQISGSTLTSGVSTFTALISSTLPYPVTISPNPTGPANSTITQTSDVPIIPTSHPDPAKATGEDKTYIFVVVTIVTILSVILCFSVVICCVRWFCGQSVSTSNQTDQSDRNQTPPGSGGRPAPAVTCPDGSQDRSRRRDRHSCRPIKPDVGDSSQTKVMELYIPTTEVKPDLTRKSEDEAFSRGEDSQSTVVHVSQNTLNPIPATSTPVQGSHGVSLAACFAPAGSPQYATLPSPSPSDSVYMTPGGDNNASSAPLVQGKKKRQKKDWSFMSKLFNKQLRGRENDAKLEEGLAAPTRTSKKSQARASSQVQIEMSASMCEDSAKSEKTQTTKISSV